MSYEYTLRFVDESQARSAYRKIETGKWVTKITEKCVALKDPNPHSWTYDVRLCWETENSLLLEIAMPSSEIYAELSDALEGLEYRCHEDGFEDEEVTLADAFRISS